MAAQDMSILPPGDAGGLVGVLDVGGRSAQCSIVDTAGTAGVRQGDTASCHCCERRQVDADPIFPKFVVFIFRVLLVGVCRWCACFSRLPFLVAPNEIEGRLGDPRWLSSGLECGTQILVRELVGLGGGMVRRRCCLR